MRRRQENNPGLLFGGYACIRNTEIGALGHNIFGQCRVAEFVAAMQRCLTLIVLSVQRRPKFNHCFRDTFPIVLCCSDQHGISKTISLVGMYMSRIQEALKLFVPTVPDAAEQFS